MIKLLGIDTSGTVPFPNAVNIDLPALRGLKTLGGFALEGHFPSIRIQLTDGDGCPTGLVDYFKVGLLNVVSLKLKGVLENFGAELEYFPITVSYRATEIVGQYFVANPLHRFRAVNVENSEVELDEEIGDALAVTKLVIDETKFVGVKLAVIAEIQRIGVQDELAKAVEISGCTGCSFFDPSTLAY